jgi:hypothetical protein
VLWLLAEISHLPTCAILFNKNQVMCLARLYYRMLNENIGGALFAPLFHSKLVKDTPVGNTVPVNVAYVLNRLTGKQVSFPFSNGVRGLPAIALAQARRAGGFCSAVVFPKISASYLLYKQSLPIPPGQQVDF